MWLLVYFLKGNLKKKNVKHKHNRQIQSLLVKGKLVNHTFFSFSDTNVYRKSVNSKAILHFILRKPTLILDTTTLWKSFASPEILGLILEDSKCTAHQLCDSRQVP